MNNSTPTVTEFDPTKVPFQYDVVKSIRKEYDYSLGKHEILLSGSVGSAKSLLIAHLAVSHCLLYPNACGLICRKTMPSLKDTILQKIIDHIGVDVSYELNSSRGIITFPNGSKLISYSWSDKKYKKARSYELSFAIIEELTENDDDEFYVEINNRIGRLPHIKENFIVSATNPDSPAHWAYERFITSPNPNRHVFYSNTFDNPFLPKTYIEQLKNDLDPKMARRMIYGEWIEINQDVIYYAYQRDNNYTETNYQINPSLPVHICWDFNIGEGKPLSCTLFQYYGDHFHCFDEVVIEGARTLDSLEELDHKGYFDKNYKIIVHGDAAGKARDTRSLRSDYDIIENYLKKHDSRIRYEMQVPRSNPPVRTRHNIVNAYCQNDLGQHRLTVYAKCKTLDKGLRLTALKKGGSYIEDDSKPYQHITTALGYGVVYTSKLNEKRNNQIRTQLR